MPHTTLFLMLTSYITIVHLSNLRKNMHMTLLTKLQTLLMCHHFPLKFYPTPIFSSGPSMGSQTVRHNWVTNTFILTMIHTACINFFNEDPKLFNDILKSIFSSSAPISRFHFNFYILLWFTSTISICYFLSWFYHMLCACYHMLGIS